MWQLLTLLLYVVLDGTMAQRTSQHQFKVLTSKRLNSLMQCSDTDLLFKYDLPGVLKPRVPGTQSHNEVKEYIVSRLQQLSCTRWNITLDSFTDTTPLGVKPFTNIVATLDPHVDRRLVLAAHYDSKLLTPVNGKQFLGATDSALPVALLLDLLISLDDKLQKRGLPEYSLQVIFFDGEEALVSWTSSDSLYGSRHLAAEMVRSGGLLSTAGKTAIEAMDAFILLDLIGASNPKFYNMYPETSDLFLRFSKIEARLQKEGQLGSNYQSFFSESALYNGGIEDDHKPFLERGVPILHLIAVPFPSVWHQLSDDASAIDRATVSNLKKIMMVFLHEYFSL